MDGNTSGGINRPRPRMDPIAFQPRLDPAGTQNTIRGVITQLLILSCKPQAAQHEDATAALLQLDHPVRKAKLAANGKLGILRIGFISTAGNEIVPTIVRQFR